MCKPISVGRPGDVRYTTRLSQSTTPPLCISVLHGHVYKDYFVVVVIVVVVLVLFFCDCCCCELDFFGLVNTVNVMSSRSLHLPSLFLHRDALFSKQLPVLCAHTFPSN